MSDFSELIQGVVFTCSCGHYWWRPKVSSDETCRYCDGNEVTTVSLANHFRNLSLEDVIEQCLHFRAQERIKRGEVNGIDTAQDFLLDQAAAAFRDGRDKDARFLRKTARSLNKVKEPTETDSRTLSAHINECPVQYWTSAVAHIIKRDYIQRTQMSREETLNLIADAVLNSEFHVAVVVQPARFQASDELTRLLSNLKQRIKNEVLSGLLSHDVFAHIGMGAARNLVREFLRCCTVVKIEKTVDGEWQFIDIEFEETD